MRKFGEPALAVLLAAVFAATAWGSMIELPRTGQTECYDVSGTQISCAGTGQDGESQSGVAWPGKRFSVNGDCVTDGLTGLVWAKNANLPDGPRTWMGSLEFVSELNRKGGLCGCTHWRLPNVIELGSLLNKQEANSAAWLNNQGFVKVQTYNYWTSTTRANHKDHAWRIQMDYGYQVGGSKSVNGYVLPVCSGNTNTK